MNGSNSNSNRGEFSRQMSIISTRGASVFHHFPDQIHDFSPHFVSETMINMSQPRMIPSQNHLIQRLYHEIDIKNSRIQELEHMYNQTAPHLARLVPSLVQEIDSLGKSKTDMERKLRDEIERLKKDCNEMGIHNRRLLEKRHVFQNLYNQEVRKVQIMNLENKRLKSELECKEKEVEQLMQAMDEGHQSDQGQGSSEEKNEDKSAIEKDHIIGDLKKELEDKKEEVQDLQILNETLLVKEHMSNNELIGVRQVLLSILKGMPTDRTALGVKRMGELNVEPFRDICALKFLQDEEDLEIRTAEICSQWEEHLKDPGWHPFKHTIIDGKLKEVIDESDERLESLRNEWGNEAYEAVKRTLLEQNEYNPSGRYPVPEIWNFKEERKASLKEAIEYVIQQTKTKNKRKRQ